MKLQHPNTLLCVCCCNPLWTLSSLCDHRRTFWFSVLPFFLLPVKDSNTPGRSHSSVLICFPLIILLAVRQIRHDSRQSEYTRTNSLSDNHGNPQMGPFEVQRSLLLGDPNPWSFSDISWRASKTSPSAVRSKQNKKSESSLGRKQLKRFQRL